MLNRDLLLEQKIMYGFSKHGQAMWEDYRDTFCLCRLKICVAKAQLKSKLANTVGTVKIVVFFFKYTYNNNSKRRTSENTGSLISKNAHVTNRDMDKVEKFNAFFASVFNTDYGLWDSRLPMWKNHNWNSNQFSSQIFFFT